MTSLGEIVLKVDLVDWLVDWSKAVAWVNEVGIDNTVGAIVPVRAIKALMADTIDVLGD